MLISLKTNLPKVNSAYDNLISLFFELSESYLIHGNFFYNLDFDYQLGTLK